MIPEKRQAVALLVGMHMLLAPILFFAIEVVLLFHGVGVPLPAWWFSLEIDLVTSYHMESVAEAFLNALPQSIIQSKLYLMGNDPNGIHVYIDTSLFLFAMVGSLFSVFKTVVLIVIELHRYDCNLLVYSFQVG